MYNILHVEQSSFFSKLVEKIVKEKGHKYINVNGFNEAREVLNSQNVSLIISSLYANGGDIEEFVGVVNKRFDIPIFIVTSEDMDDKRKDLVNLGISEYILKKDLEEEIRNYLDNIFRADEYMRDLQEANIAIVEDNEFFIEFEREILRSRKIYNVDYYKDGKSLIDSKKKYDIYLIDIILQNEFGKDLIRKIRRSNIDS
ncbi:response regulator, partial [Clostridium tertium]|uniref:response regulator n=1 Tax=Clostridium tertium TaxID=1559 RepID=UPI0024B38E6D